MKEEDLNIVIGLLEDSLKRQKAEIKNTKIAINELYKVMGNPLRYAIEPEPSLQELLESGRLTFIDEEDEE